MIADVVTGEIDIHDVMIAAAVNDVAPDGIEEYEESENLTDETRSDDEEMAEAED